MIDIKGIKLEKSHLIIGVGVLLAVVLYFAQGGKEQGISGLTGERNTVQHKPDSLKPTSLAPEGDTVQTTLKALLSKVNKVNEQLDRVEADVTKHGIQLQTQKSEMEDIRRLARDLRTSKSSFSGLDAKSITDKAVEVKEEIKQTSSDILKSLPISGESSKSNESKEDQKNKPLSFPDVTTKPNDVSPESADGGFAFKDLPGRMGFDFSKSKGSSTRSDVPMQAGQRIMPVDRPDLLDENAKKGHSKVTQKSTDKKKEKREPIPIYTIPDNTKLTGAISWDAMVGRLPVNGKVVDPFQVRFFVSKDNLAANGHVIPQLDGMVFSGYAEGDLLLKCVRVRISSYTYIFKDGRISSHRDDITKSGDKEDLADVSSSSSFPCIKGSLVSDAAKYIGIKGTLRGLAVAGEKYSEAQTVQTGTPLGGTQQQVVDAGKYAKGAFGTEVVGVGEEWVNQRLGNSFDAIIAPTGTEVTINLNREIPIDYDFEARKVSYDNKNISSLALD